MITVESMYSKYKDLMKDYFGTDEFYNIFIQSIKSGSNTFSSYQKYMDHEIDIRWVEAIERAIIPLDNIIRNPRSFIQNVEEIVPIEQARKITSESLRHLAQHTNMIANVSNDGFVTPQKILNVFKEETFATYENRFIYTLLHNLQYFIDKRLRIIQNSKIETIYELKVQNEFNIGKEEVKYEFSLSSKESVEKSKLDFKIDQDTSEMPVVKRVERLRKIIYDFQNSQLIKSLHGVTLVKPPIMKTNVIMKNPDFKKCLELWYFIERYRDAGLLVKVVEESKIPSTEYINDLLDNLTLNYLIFNHHNKPDKNLSYDKPKFKEFAPNIINKVLEEYISEFSLDIDSVERIFVDQIKKTTQRHRDEEEKVKEALDRIIAAEQDRQDSRKDRIVLSMSKKSGIFYNDTNDKQIVLSLNKHTGVITKKNEKEEVILYLGKQRLIISLDKKTGKLVYKYPSDVLIYLLNKNNGALNLHNGEYVIIPGKERFVFSFKKSKKNEDLIFSLPKKKEDEQIIFSIRKK